MNPDPVLAPQGASLRLPEPAYWALWLLFGASSAGALRLWVPPELAFADRALFALSISLLVTAIGWFFLLGLQCGFAWALAMLIPYVNLIAISIFARRYWTRGARAPALLVLVSSLLQLALLLRWALATPGSSAA